MAKTTACGQQVWVLYANSGDNRAPIRTVIENGRRKIHLFDFIQAMTGCDENSKVNEWNRVQTGLDNNVMTKIMTSNKYRFPMIGAQKLTSHDSMVIDIFQAVKIASVIGKRANWFNGILQSLGCRFLGGDLQLIRDVKYMNTAQQLIQEHDPDNFLRLWGEEYLYNSQIAQQTQEDTNPEQIIDANTRTVKVIMDGAGITRRRINLRRKGRSSSGARHIDLYRDAIGVIYVYLIIPRFRTREEALEHLRNLGITTELDDSVIICTDDLKGRLLIKVGKTEDLPEKRQTNYIRTLQALYIEDEQHLTEYPIKFIAKLSDVEGKVKEAFFTEEAIGLIRDNGTVYYPNEVFPVDSVKSAQQIVKQTVEQLQIGKLINRSDDPELTRMRETTRQLELRSEIQRQNIQMQTLQMKKGEMLERNGASKANIIKLLLKND